VYFFFVFLYFAILVVSLRILGHPVKVNTLIKVGGVAAKHSFLSIKKDKTRLKKIASNYEKNMITKQANVQYLSRLLITKL
jgi:hypothetical protein